MSEKKLKRSSSNKMIAGVLGGVAEYVDVDATIVRLIYAIATFFSVGSLVLVYLIAMLVMPQE